MATYRQVRLSLAGSVLTWLLGIFPSHLHAQQLSGLRATQTESDVLISYVLEGTAGKTYTISIYSSVDNFAIPLQRVEGDVGDKRVTPGAGKQIRWHAADELKRFDGDITFEVRAVIAAPLFRDIQTSATTVKRGRSVSVTWAGGTPSDKVNLALSRNGVRENEIEIDNTGSYQFTVPRKQKKGSYILSITQNGEETLGGNLTVKPRVPFLVKALPIIVAGAVVAVLSNRPVEGGDDFPEPPDITK